MLKRTPLFFPSFAILSMVGIKRGAVSVHELLLERVVLPEDTVWRCTLFFDAGAG